MKWRADLRKVRQSPISRWLTARNKLKNGKNVLRSPRLRRFITSTRIRNTLLIDSWKATAGTADTITHRWIWSLFSLNRSRTTTSVRERLERFPSVKGYPTIADALTLGGEELAVDGVLIIGEHGEYPTNEKGQRLYPRYEHFMQIAEVYEKSGRGVPTFNDKHLSWNWEWAREMYDISQSMDFAFMAGSSLPVTWRTPSIDMPLGVPISEAVCVGYGGVDSYDFHALETLQCMVERREGGESGVKWLQAYRGDAFWEAHHTELWSRELFETALCRSHTLTPSRPGFNNPFPNIDELKDIVKDPIAYQYEHNDGLKSTMILMNGLVQDFNFAAHIGTDSEILSTQMYLPMPPARTTLANFFSPLVNNIEKMFLDR